MGEDSASAVQKLCCHAVGAPSTHHVVPTVQGTTASCLTWWFGATVAGHMLTILQSDWRTRAREIRRKAGKNTCYACCGVASTPERENGLQTDHFQNHRRMRSYTRQRAT